MATFIKTAKQFAQIYGVWMSPYRSACNYNIYVCVGSIFQPGSLSETVKPQRLADEALVLQLLLSIQLRVHAPLFCLRQQQLRGPKRGAQFTSAAQLVGWG